MRIITGKYKARRLTAPPGTNTRPTSDKVRESIFAVLGSMGIITDADVLDLFGGTGALGIEALSRGAVSAVFIEKNPDCVAVLKKNLAFVTEPVEVYNTDWKVAVRKLACREFKLIFVDPPYALRLERLVADEIIKHGILADDGCIIIEHSSDKVPTFDEDIFDVYIKNYSGTSVTYLTKKNSAETSRRQND